MACSDPRWMPARGLKQEPEVKRRSPSGSASARSGSTTDVSDSDSEKDSGDGISSVSSSDSEMDLTKDYRPIGDYIHNRREMVRHMFHAVRGRQLNKLIPAHLKTVPREQLQQMCIDELEGMSKKRVRRTLAGEEVISSSSSESDSSSEQSVLLDDSIEVIDSQKQNGTRDRDQASEADEVHSDEDLLPEEDSRVEPAVQDEDSPAVDGGDRPDDSEQTLRHQLIAQMAAARDAKTETASDGGVATARAQDENIESLRVSPERIGDQQAAVDAKNTHVSEDNREDNPDTDDADNMSTSHEDQTNIDQDAVQFLPDEHTKENNVDENGADAQRDCISDRDVTIESAGETDSKFHPGDSGNGAGCATDRADEERIANTSAAQSSIAAALVAAAAAAPGPAPMQVPYLQRLDDDDMMGDAAVDSDDAVPLDRTRQEDSVPSPRKKNQRPIAAVMPHRAASDDECSSDETGSDAEHEEVRLRRRLRQKHVARALDAAATVRSYALDDTVQLKTTHHSAVLRTALSDDDARCRPDVPGTAADVVGHGPGGSATTKAENDLDIAVGTSGEIPADATPAKVWPPLKSKKAPSESGGSSVSCRKTKVNTLSVAQALLAAKQAGPHDEQDMNSEVSLDSDYKDPYLDSSDGEGQKSEHSSAAAAAPGTAEGGKSGSASVKSASSSSGSSSSSSGGEADAKPSGRSPVHTNLHFVDYFAQERQREDEMEEEVEYGPEMAPEKPDADGDVEEGDAEEGEIVDEDENAPKPAVQAEQGESEPELVEGEQVPQKPVKFKCARPPGASGSSSSSEDGHLVDDTAAFGGGGMQCALEGATKAAQWAKAHAQRQQQQVAAADDDDEIEVYTDATGTSSSSDSDSDEPGASADLAPPGMGNSAASKKKSKFSVNMDALKNMGVKGQLAMLRAQAKMAAEERKRNMTDQTDGAATKPLSIVSVKALYKQLKAQREASKKKSKPGPSLADDEQRRRHEDRQLARAARHATRQEQGRQPAGPQLPQDAARVAGDDSRRRRKKRKTALDAAASKTGSLSPRSKRLDAEAVARIKAEEAKHASDMQKKRQQLHDLQRKRAEIAKTAPPKKSTDRKAKSHKKKDRKRGSDERPDADPVPKSLSVAFELSGDSEPDTADKPHFIRQYPEPRAERAEKRRSKRLRRDVDRSPQPVRESPPGSGTAPRAAAGTAAATQRRGSTRCTGQGRG